MSAWPAYDFFVVTNNTLTYPLGQGRSTATAGSNIAPAGKRVILHAVVALGAAAGTVDIRNAGNTTSYFTDKFANGASAPGQNLDVELLDGLSVQGASVSAGAFLIIFKLLG